MMSITERQGKGKKTQRPKRLGETQEEIFKVVSLWIP
jgi:hypothetical protein